LEGISSGIGKFRQQYVGWLKLSLYGWGRQNTRRRARLQAHVHHLAAAKQRAAGFVAHMPRSRSQMPPGAKSAMNTGTAWL